MKLTLVAAVTGLCSLLSFACVTRNKHESTVATWQDRLDQASAENSAALATRDREIAALRGQMTDAQAGAASKQAELSASLKASQEEIAALRAQRAKIEANLRQYQELRDAFKRMISAGNLDIYKRRGHIMVALPSSVLFQSGKADLSPAGEKALAEVATVLSKVKRHFLVAGHTDNVPIKTERHPDNWALSAERATVVTRFLITNGMPPTHLAAAAYSKYDPVRKNTSPQNRQRNRRIEIILMPDIDELPSLP